MKISDILYLIAVVILLIWLALCSHKDTLLTAQNYKLQSILNTQNQALQQAQIESDKVQDSLDNYQRQITQDNIELSKRMDVVLNVPEIEDCEAAVKWSAKQSSQIAQRFMHS